MAKTIAVLSPAGDLGDIPADQLKEALANGYTQATPEVIKRHDQEKEYGGTGGQLASAALGAANTASFGTIPLALAKTGLLPSETQSALKEVNPTAYGTGEVGGILGSIVALPGAGLVGAAERGGAAIAKRAASLLPEATGLGAQVLKGAGTVGLGGAVEGALYGMGNVLNEEALGDHDLNAESIIGDIGFGAVIGGAFGSALGAASPLLNRGAKEVAEQAVRSGKEPTKEAMLNEIVTGTPSSISDIRTRVKQADYMGMDLKELPQKEALEKANAVLSNSQFPVHEVQLEALSDPYLHDIYRAAKESNSELGQVFKQYESAQKIESVKHLDSSIRSLAPEAKLTGDAYQGGVEIVDAFRTIYKESKNADKEVFETLKKVAPDLQVESHELLRAIDNALPGAQLDKIMKLGDGGDLVMQPYKSSMPFSKESYNAIKEIVGGMDNQRLTVEGLRNVRKAVDNMITFELKAGPKSELTSLKRSLMDLMEGTVEKKLGDLPVRDAFKRYAINEKNAELMEKVFGGKLSDKESLLRQIKPEELGDKVFRNSATVQVAKEILPPEVFNKLAGNYLMEQVGKFTDAGNFKSNSFARWLKSNETGLQLALSDNPQLLETFKALADKMRLLPDAAPMNTSGTAKSINLFNALSDASNTIKGVGAFVKEPWEIPGKILSKLGDTIENRNNMRMLESVLSGAKATEAKAVKMSIVERTINNAKKNLERFTKDIFQNSKEITKKALKPAIPVSFPDQVKAMEKIKDDIAEKTGDDSQYLETVENATKDIYDALPGTSASMQATMIRATNFLKSKIPNTDPVTPLGNQRVPSAAELNKFFKYATVVENPYTVLKQIKNNTLCAESMETMATVYPRLLGDMQAAIVDKLADLKAKGKDKSLPYNTKVMLSAFLQRDLVTGVTQHALFMNSASWMGPSSKQDNIDMANMQNNAGQSKQNPITLASRSNSFTREVTERRNS